MTHKKPISTAEAARRLGVSMRRVQALISQGRIKATLLSGIWLVDAASVEKFERRPAGRPALST